ncbi:MAG: alkaline phosphatase family protein [Bacillota bacterium]
MKVINLLLDGIGDRSYKILDNKTPLDYAKTPNLDLIAKKSQCGLMTPLDYGKVLGTDLAHFILFGYTLKEYPNRSVIDALGEGIKLDKETLVLRASFANVEKKEDGFLIKERFCKDLKKEEIKKIIKKINRNIDGFKFKVIHSYDSHLIILVKGKKLSKNISDSDPFYSPQYAMKVEPFETNKDLAYKTSKLINKFLKENFLILDNLDFNKKRKEMNLKKANFILTKWAGKYKSLDSFKKRTGKSGLILAKSDLFKGISEILDINYLRYKSFDDAIDLALKSKKEYIHLHTKLPDSASHKKDPFLKVKEIEKIDKKIEKLLDFKGLLIVTGDHSTPCSGKMIHSGESVPFMAKGEFVRVDDVKEFNEISCSKGSMFIKGKDFIPFVQNASDSAKLYHLRQGNKRYNYRIKNINKLK